MAVGWKTQRRVNGGAAGTPLSLAQRIIHALPMRKRLPVIYCTNQARALYRGSFSPPPLPLPGKSITCQKTDRQSKCEVLGWHVFRRVCEGIIKRRDGQRVSQILVCALHADGRHPGGMLLGFFVEHLYDDLEMIVPDACWIFRFLKLCGCCASPSSGTVWNVLESQMCEWPDAQVLFNANRCTEWWSPVTIHLQKWGLDIWGDMQHPGMKLTFGTLLRNKYEMSVERI